MKPSKYDPKIMPSFNFYRSWVGMFRALDLDDRAILLNWCCWYCFEQSEPNLTEKWISDELANAWESLRPELEKQLSKWTYYANMKNNEDF